MINASLPAFPKIVFLHLQVVCSKVMQWRSFLFGVILFRTIKKFNVVAMIFPPHSRPANGKITDAFKVSLPLK